MSALSIRELFEQYELNVYDRAIMNPADAEGRITNHKSFGINVMRQMLELGTLHVNENCTEFLKEAQNYYVDPHGRFSDPDDCIDSARYALLGCLQQICEPYDNKTPQQRMARVREAYYDRKAINELSKPSWKKTHDPSGR